MITLSAGIGAGVLTLIALLHSVLGERTLLGPLLAAEWRLPGIPRWAAARILRFAWHLTSFAWLALAAALLGVSPAVAVAGCAAASGLVIFVLLRGHLAWPLFFGVAAAALHHAGLLTEGHMLGVAAAAGAVAALLAGLHIYWAGGGRWGIAVALPTAPDGARPFTPSPALTAAVAGALAVWAALLIAVPLGEGPGWLRWLLLAGAGVLALRAVGDGRLMGFSKVHRDSPFATWDDALFTPLAVLMAAGGLGGFLIAT